MTMATLATRALAEGDWLASLLAMEPDDILVIGLRALLIVVIGVIVGRVLSSTIGRMLERRASPQQEMIARRVIYYGVIVATLMTLLDTFGVEVGVLLGAAGILTVALGFASQTSASNLISGLFLLGEQPFVVGDTIQVASFSGEVLSVDMLSVKLRTFDNLYLRVPNETLIKSEILNMTRNPIRRIAIDLRLAYDEDVARVRAIVFAFAEHDPDVLEEPGPRVWIDALGESAILVRIVVWAANGGGWYDTRSRVMEELARGFREQGIALGYPRLSLARGREVEAPEPDVEAPRP